jgi:hypothetical protein
MTDPSAVFASKVRCHVIVSKYDRRRPRLPHLSARSPDLGAGHSPSRAYRMERAVSPEVWMATTGGCIRRKGVSRDIPDNALSNGLD